MVKIQPILLGSTSEQFGKTHFEAQNVDACIFEHLEKCRQLPTIFVFFTTVPQNGQTNGSKLKTPINGPNYLPTFFCHSSPVLLLFFKYEC